MTTTSTKRRAPDLPPSIAAATWRTAEQSTDTSIDVCDGSGSNCSMSGDTHLGLTVMLPDGSHIITEVDSKLAILYELWFAINLPYACRILVKMMQDIS